MDAHNQHPQDVLGQAQFDDAPDPIHREQLLEQSLQAWRTAGRCDGADSTSNPWRRIMRKRIIPLAAAACVAAAVVLVAWLLVGTSSPAVQSAYAQLKEVVENSKNAQWVHMSTLPPAWVPVPVVCEQWMRCQPLQHFSCDEKQVVTYLNYQTGQQSRYDPQKKTITITRLESNPMMDSMAGASNIFEAFMTLLDAQVKLGGGTVEQGQLIENGTALTTFTLTFANGNEQIRLLADPVAKRMVRMSTMDKNEAGRWRAGCSTDFDYPADGPADLYALGVPKDATIVDLTPKPEMIDLGEKLEANRRAFADTYFAVMYMEVPPASHTSATYDLLPSAATLAWKKAGRYRFDHFSAVVRVNQDTATPTDMAVAEERTKGWDVYSVDLFTPRVLPTYDTRQFTMENGQLKRGNGGSCHYQALEFVCWPELDMNVHKLVPPAPGDAPGLITLERVDQGQMMRFMRDNVEVRQPHYPMRTRLTFDAAHNNILIRQETIQDAQGDWVEDKNWLGDKASDPKVANFYLRRVMTVQDFATTAAGRMYARTSMNTECSKRDGSDEHLSYRQFVFLDTARPIAEGLFNPDSITAEFFQHHDRPATQPASSPAATTAPGF